jgi:NADH-quinone oxidoreductase subunit J
MINTILFIFSIFTIYCAFSVIFNNNIIISILYLIATFINTSIILILFGFEFFALIFIAIYAGAIAILFLFILMMINIPYFYPKKPLFYELIIIFFIIQTIFFLVNYISHLSILLPNNLYNTSIILFNHNYTDSLELISALLYTHYGVYVILAGIILFIAMIGSIMVFEEYKFNYNLKKYNNNIILVKKDNVDLKD